MATPSIPNPTSLRESPLAQRVKNMYTGALHYGLMAFLTSPLLRIQRMVQCDAELVASGRLPRQFGRGRVAGSMATWDCLQSTVRHEQFLGATLFRGNNVNFVRIAGLMTTPLYGVTPFMVSKWSHEWVRTHKFKFFVVVGAVAATKSVLEYPVQMLHTRRLADPVDKLGSHLFTNYRSVLQHVVSGDGIRGVFRGLMPYMSMRVLGSGALFYYISGRRTQQMPPTPVVRAYQRRDFATGHTSFQRWMRTPTLVVETACVTAVTLALLYPLDTISNRMKLRAGSTTPYANSLECLSTIVRHASSSSGGSSGGGRDVLVYSVRQLYRGVGLAMVAHFVHNFAMLQLVKYMAEPVVDDDDDNFPHLREQQHERAMR